MGQADLPERVENEPGAGSAGALAVYLYRQVDKMTATGRRTNSYARIKILRRKAESTPTWRFLFLRKKETSTALRPGQSGRMARFELRREAFDKTIVKAKGVKFLAKTFTLAHVQVGSIIEYHYTCDLNEGYVYNSHWILTGTLHQARQVQSSETEFDFALRWSWPPGCQRVPPPRKMKEAFVRLGRRYSRIQIEDYMPPQNELNFALIFVYSEGVPEKEPDNIWKKKEGKKLNDRVKAFTGKRKAMEQAVGEIVAPNDTPE